MKLFWSLFIPIWRSDGSVHMHELPEGINSTTWLAKSVGWCPLRKRFSQVLGFEQLRHPGSYFVCLYSAHGISSAWCDLPFLNGKFYSYFNLQSKYYVSSEKISLITCCQLYHLFFVSPQHLHISFCVKALLILNCNCLYFCLNYVFQDRSSWLLFDNSHAIHSSFAYRPLYLAQSRISATPLIAYLMNYSREEEDKSWELRRTCLII